MCSPGEMKAFQRNIPDACSQTINVCGRSCCSEQFSSCVTCEAASAEQMLAYELDLPCPALARFTVTKQYAVRTKTAHTTSMQEQQQ